MANNHSDTQTNPQKRKSDNALITTKKKDIPTTFFQPSNLSEVTREFSYASKIEDLINYLVSDKFGCGDVDCDPWIEKLHQNLITNVGLLCRLSVERLARLDLPLLLEEELANIIKSTCEKSPKEPFAFVKSESIISRIHKPSTKSSVHERSAFLGVTAKERELIIQSWNSILAHEGERLDLVFQSFYHNFFRIDKTARRLFQGRSLEKQARALMKVMQMIITTLEDPTTTLPYLQKLGTRHLIYGVTSKDFQSFAIALTQTLQEIIPDQMTPILKEAWFVLITKLGQTMTDSYETVAKGVHCSCYKATEKGKKLYCVLTHESLNLFKDEQMTKEQHSLYLKWVSDIDITQDEKYTKHHPYCFSITLSGVPFFFCVDTEEDLNWWIDQLTERVAAHQRVAGDDDSESSGQEPVAISSANSVMQSKSMKKLRQRLLKKATTENTGISTSSNSQ